MYDVTSLTGVKRVADTLQTTGRDLLSDWLCILIKPNACLHFEHELLPFFAKCDTIIDRAAASFSRHRIGKKQLSFTLNGIKRYRVDLIHGNSARSPHSS